MALVLAFDDAKTKQVRTEGDRVHSTGGYTHIPFFGSRDNPHLPHAALNQRDSARTAGPHFHVSDQFQVVIGGKGKLGRHDVAAYCVHFARAYTPYGPLVSDDTGLTFIVMRAHHDPGAQFLPENKDKLKQVTDRQPWQITRPFAFPTLQSGTAAQDIMLQGIPDIKDELGLAAYTLSMNAHAQARAPDPSHGEGQYLVVLKGSLLHNNKEHKALALVFVEPNEDAFQIHAGSAGLGALILNFPQVKPHTVRTLAPSTLAGFKKWQCALCSFAYDETLGIPEEGILAGTRWEDVPENWSCPDCSASKSDFQMVEI